MSTCTKRWMISLLIITNLFSLAISQYEAFFCSQNGNYTKESLYRADLNSLLNSLSSNIDNTGFYSASVGQANAIALCRADIQHNTCQGCVNIVAKEILGICPNQYQAVMWYEFCMVRYSNDNITGRLAISPGTYFYNRNNMTSPGSFKVVREELMDDVRARAANGGPLRKAAVGNRTGPDDQEIFALLQCTPDLSPVNCSRCLVQATQYISALVNDTIGIRLYTPSCLYRYEPSQFYNDTRLEEPLTPPLAPPLVSSPPPPPPPPLLPFPPPPGKDNENRTRSTIIIVVSIVACLFLAFCIGIYAMKRRKQKKIPENPAVVDDIGAVESIQYDFGEIRAATNDFSDDNKLGEGGFGAVYRGKVVNGEEIAVKRLSKDSGQGDIEFKNEVLLVAKLQHRNLVRLLGFSIEGIERLLIYEFVPNGSLDQFLFDRIKSSNLDWDTRYKVIAGIAKGVLYLHEDSRLQIIHRDLKTSNILLDKDMNPKISDFGMAKLIVSDETQKSTSRIVGTYGYMAPEYAIYGRFSVKSDVFSFGVLILEIITGQRKIFVQNGQTSGDLLSYVWRSWREGTIANTIDPILRATSGSQRDMIQCIHIALLCVQENAVDRPTMASVVIMMNSLTITLPMPSRPGFYVPEGSFSGASIPQDHSLKASTVISQLLSPQSDHSANNKYSSISDLYPR